MTSRAMTSRVLHQRQSIPTIVCHPTRATYRVPNPAKRNIPTVHHIIRVMDTKAIHTIMITRTVLVNGVAANAKRFSIFIMCMVTVCVPRAQLDTGYRIETFSQGEHLWRRLAQHVGHVVFGEFAELDTGNILCNILCTLAIR